MEKNPLYILCGGQSRRMGTDKAVLQIEDESLLNRQIRRAAPFFDRISLLTGENRYHLDLPSIQDAVVNAGPLAGLLAAMNDAKHRHAHLAVLPVDVPFLQEETIEDLARTSPVDSVDAVMLRHSDIIQPLAGVFRTDLSPDLDSYLSKGGRRVMKWIGTLNCRYIEVTEQEIKNLNYPDQFHS